MTRGISVLRCPKGPLAPQGARRALRPLKDPRTLGAQRELSRNYFLQRSFIRIYVCAVELDRVDGQARSAIRIMFFYDDVEAIFSPSWDDLNPKNLSKMIGLGVIV